MFKFKSLVFVCLLLCPLFLATSCEKEDELEPGIIYTDSPPEELFSNGIYANTSECWIDAASLSDSKDMGYKCNSYYDDEEEVVRYYNCGEWHLVPARKFWGIKQGIIYLSVSRDWYIANPSIYTEMNETVKKVSTAIGRMYYEQNNPIGGNYLTVSYIE